MNTKLRTEARNYFEKYLFKLTNNSVFGKTMENVRKHRYIKLLTNDERRNQLVSEPNYHITKWFSEGLQAIEMKKMKVKMNKPIYFGLPILENSKKFMYGNFGMIILKENIKSMHNLVIWILTDLLFILKL